MKLSGIPVPNGAILNRSQAILMYDETKGELRIEGQRYATIQVEAMCKHPDTLVGTRLAVTIILGSSVHY